MILRILFFLAILLLLPAWGIDRTVLRNRCRRTVRFLFFLPNLLLLAGLTVMAVNENYTPEAAYLKGLLLTCVLCLAVPEALAALLLAVGRCFGLQHPSVRNAFGKLAAVTGLLCFGLLLYGFTIGYRQIVVKDFTYTDRKIPQAFSGYRIVQLSDLHLGTLHGHNDVVRRIVDSVNSCRPDLIVFTGDLVNYRAEELFEAEAELRRLKARDGIVSIMGNHDYMAYHRWGSEEERLQNIRLLQEHERAIGWNLLLNRHVLIRRGNDSIAVLGVENDGNPPFPALGDIPAATKGLGEECFKVLLSHDPSHWRRRVLPETDIPLMLAGHTHGMQFKVGSFSPAVWFYPEWGGAYTEKGQTLYVSLGTGEVLLPFRLGAWPEINVIELQTEHP